MGFKVEIPVTGGRTYFRLSDYASTDLSVNGEETEGVTIELGGDAELITFIETLEFAVKVLKEQIKENDQYLRYYNYE